MFRDRWAPLLLGGRRLGCALDGMTNDLEGLLWIRPAPDLDPLAGLKILVMPEEVSDLLDQDFGKGPVGGNVGIEGMELVDRDHQDLLIETAFILQYQGAYRSGPNDRP